MGGIAWTSNNLPGINCVACSADAVKWVAAGHAQLFTSTNSGVSWRTNSVVDNSWTAVASSADGTKLVMAGAGNSYNGPIYTSKDSGLTWQSTPAPLRLWDDVASSADGNAPGRGRVAQRVLRWRHLCFYQFRNQLDADQCAGYRLGLHCLN